MSDVERKKGRGRKETKLPCEGEYDRSTEQKLTYNQAVSLLFFFG